MRPIGWFLFLLFCIVMFCLAFVPLLTDILIILVGLFGMGESAGPLALTLTVVAIIGSIAWGVIDANK